MLRLSVLLCAALFVTLLIAGEDKGQMRPGLAAAVAEGREIVVIERQFSAPVVLPERTEALPEVEVAAPVAPAAEAPPPAAAAEEPVVMDAAYTPPDAEDRAAEVAARRAMPEPVFTLSALPSIGGDEARIAEEEPVADAGLSGNVWYVEANSVNVRQGPSTDTSVVGKLTNGEAVTVIAEADSDWVQIVIEGDGVEGYVAARFLSPVAP